ncbi:MAG: prepilin-type N-terminal cleavage/methylation domain-containing protein [Planctomycetota bacterium]|nr:MAG: prepilin-type N-terminal cleavage/methylation domain-containing protein [Planctomycetota bacterium]
MNPSPKKPKGFTLVELLVVIAIIAFLVAALVTAVGYVKRRAKVAKTTGLLQNIKQALTAYMADTNGVPPSAKYSNDSALDSEFFGQSGTTAPPNNIALVDSLCLSAEDGGEKNGPYLNLKGYVEAVEGKKLPSGSQVKANGGQPVVIDAWRNPLFYRSKWYYNGSTYVKHGSMKKEYEIKSMGPDGKTGDSSNDSQGYTRDDILESN